MLFKIFLLFIAPLAIVAAILGAIHLLVDEKLWFKKRRFVVVPFAFLMSCFGGNPAVPLIPKDKTVEPWEYPAMAITAILVLAAPYLAYTFFTG